MLERPRPSTDSSAMRQPYTADAAEAPLVAKVVPASAPAASVATAPSAEVVSSEDSSAMRHPYTADAADAPPAATVVPASVAAAPSAEVVSPEAVDTSPVALEAPAAPAAARTEPPAPAAVTRDAQRRPTAVALSAQERREASMFAELFSIFVTTEHLEAAFVRGAVSNVDYERNIRQILAQFKTLQTGLKQKCPDVRAFIREQGVHCPLAEERLLSTGVAATALYGHGSQEQGKESLACFKASEGFITLSDALKLRLDAVDDLLPLVRDLQGSIISIPNLPPLAGLERFAGWLITLHGMRASDHLTEEQCRQMAMDVEQGYSALKNYLQDKT